MIGWLGKSCIRESKYEEDLQTHLVTVKQIDLDWLLKNEKHFLEVALVLSEWAC